MGRMRRHKAWVAFGACWLLAAATLVVVAGAALGGWGAEPHAEADVLFGVAAVMITAPLIPLMGLFFMFCLYCIWIGLALNLAILEFVWLRLSGLGSRSSHGRAGHCAAYAAPRGGPDPHGYYTALGVDPRSSHRLIRVAYRRQALRNHPDRGGSVRRMQTINEAWAVVGDSVKRRAYDAGAAAV
jgi:DnaJ domain